MSIMISRFNKVKRARFFVRLLSIAWGLLSILILLYGVNILLFQPLNIVIHSNVIVIAEILLLTFIATGTFLKNISSWRFFDKWFTQLLCFIVTILAVSYIIYIRYDSIFLFLSPYKVYLNIFGVVFFLWYIKCLNRS